MNIGSWQVRTALIITVLAPPIAAIVVSIATYWPSWVRDGSVDVIGFLFTLILFSIPVTYIFGAIPALLAGAIYCLVLTYVPQIRDRIFIRSVMAAFVGGAIGGSCCYWILKFPPLYGLIAALTSVVLALFLPQRMETSSNI